MRALVLALLLAGCVTAPARPLHRPPPIKEVAAATSDALENARTAEYAYRSASAFAQMAVEQGMVPALRLDSVAALDDRAFSALEDLRGKKPGTPEAIAAKFYFNFAIEALLKITEEDPGVEAPHHH